MYRIPDKQYSKIKIAHLNLKALWWNVIEAKNEANIAKFNIAKFNEVAKCLQNMVVEERIMMTNALRKLNEEGKKMRGPTSHVFYQNWCEAWRKYYALTLEPIHVGENAPEKANRLNMTLPRQHFDRLQLKVQKAGQNEPPVETKKIVYVKEMKKLLEHVEIATILSGNSVLDTKFLHVSHEICSYWGTERFYNYMYDLSINTRLEPRQGFPKAAWLEIQHIKKYHATKYPSTVPKDIWSFS